MGFPVAYEFCFPNDYNDSLEIVFSENNIDENSMIRVISDNYPSYAIGVININKSSGSIDIAQVYSGESGDQINVSDLKITVTTDEALKDPQLTQNIDATQIQEIQDELYAYKADVEAFWNETKSNPKCIQYVKTKKTLEYYMIKNYNTNIGSVRPVWMGHWCGHSSICWALGYMRNIGGYVDLQSIFDPTNSDMFANLSEACGVDPWSNDDAHGITYPWKLKEGVENATKNQYTCLWAFLITPKIESIKNNIPLISLRAFKCNKTGLAWHYRDVVGIKAEGWWIFKWWYYCIHDHNGLDGKGNWEAYSPIYHVYTGRIIKK